MSKSAPPLIRVRDWDRLFENNRSRDMKNTAWFPAPNDLGADTYVELVTHEDGAGHLGVWFAILMVSSRGRPRGYLTRRDGQSHTSGSLARLTRLPEHLIEIAISRLLEIGLLEFVDNDPSSSNGPLPHPSAANPHPAAGEPHANAEESQESVHRTEGNHHQEEKRKRREQQRTEPEGTEGARGDSTTRSSDPPREAGFSFSKKSDDSKEQFESHYASPEDELKAIYFSKTGEHITIALLSAIRTNLELTCVSMSDFVMGVREHAKNEWRNPAGFLRDLSKRFVAKTRRASRPKTAAEADAENYQCKICASRTPGEGAVPGSDAKFQPCACASQEYITRQRARGVFAEEVAP